MNAQQVVAVIKHRLWIVILVPAVAVPVAVFLTSFAPPVYTTSATVMVDIRRPSEGGLSGELIPAGLAETYIATQVGVIDSQPVAIRAASLMGLADSPDWQAAYRESRPGGEPSGFDQWAGGLLRESISVQPRKNSRLIDIWASGPDPEFAASTANAFAEAYRETTRDMLNAPATETRASLEAKLETLRAKLEDAQANLTSFQSKTGIFATDERIDIETARLAELSNQLLSAEAETRAATSRESILNDAIASGKPLDSLPEILANSTVQGLKTSLAEKESELVQVSADLGPQHPTRKTLESQVQALRSSLDQETRTVADGIRVQAALARDQLASVRQAESAQRTTVQDLRTARDSLPSLMQQVATAGDNYNRALEAYGQYDMQISLSQTDVTVFDRAPVPSEPVGPSTKKNAALALVIGAMLGFLLAFVLHLIRPRILSKDDLGGTSALSYPREIPKAHS